MHSLKITSIDILNKVKIAKLVKLGLIVFWITFPYIWGKIESSFDLKWYLYEVNWYISMLLVIVIPYIMKWKIKTVIPSFRIHFSSITNLWKFILIFLAVFVSLLSIIDCFSALNGSPNSYSGIYESAFYIVFLCMMRIVIFFPSILSIFVIFYEYMFMYMKKKFENCLTANDLLSNVKYIRLHKWLCSLLFFGYVVFFSCTVIAYKIKPIVFGGNEIYVHVLMTIIKGDPVEENIDIAFMLHLLFMLIPIITACFFYYFTSSWAKYIVTNGIIKAISSGNKITDDDMKRIQFIYFNNCSPYTLNSRLITYLSVAVVPAVTTALAEQLIRFS